MKKEHGNRGRCKLCDREYTNLYSHILSAHKQKAVKWSNWTPLVQKRKYTQRASKPVITPEMKYIDVPVILRIPLNIGQTRIISGELK